LNIAVESRVAAAKIREGSSVAAKRKLGAAVMMRPKSSET